MLLMSTGEIITTKKFCSQILVENSRQCCVTSTYPDPLDTIGQCRSAKTDMKRQYLWSIDPGSTVYRQPEDELVLLVY